MDSGDVLRMLAVFIFCCYAKITSGPIMYIAEALVSWTGRSTTIPKSECFMSNNLEIMPEMNSVSSIIVYIFIYFSCNFSCIIYKNRNFTRKEQSQSSDKQD
eukprot:425141_1